MVKPITFAKSEHFLKRELVLAITLFVIVFSFLANFAFSAETKISAEQVERIKFVLDMVGTTSKFGSILVDDGGLMKALNTVISGGQTATDVTYGLLVLSAINEMEFIDLVVSQDYKTLQREYFEQILKERASLQSYWKSVGFDIPRVVSGNITGPVGALTLNTFEMTDKIVLIFTEFETLKKGKQYDGLWRYFDERRNGESHQGAWELAEPQVGWAANSVGFHGIGQRQKQKIELEQQFATLYEKWAPYTTPFGVKEEYKQQVKSDLRNTLALAIEEHTEDGPLYAEGPSLWDRFLVQLENIKNTVAKLVSQINPFKAGPIVELPAEAQLPAEARPSRAEETADVGFPPAFDENQEDLDDFLEEQDILNREPTVEGPIAPEEGEPEEIMEVEPPLMEVQPPLSSDEPAAEEVEPAVPEDVVEEVAEIRSLPNLCMRGDGGVARQYRVLINEVAWMGDQDSPNNEWIELKNVWGIPVNLAGWQLQDKDWQIKVIFEEGEEISAGGYLLLERSKDYTGALNNTDEAIYLFDNNCQLEDEVSAMPDWPGGDNYSKKTMQRFDVFSWYDGLATPGAENGPPPAILTHPSASAPAPAKKSYPKILITEIQIEHASSADYDFIKLYNPNNETADVSDHQLKKRTSTGSEYSVRVFPGGSVIPAKGYFLWANYGQADVTSTQTLAKNNSIALFDPEKNILDQAAWGSSINPFVEGQPYPKNSDETETLLRKWSSTTQSYIDTDDNSEDFQIQGGGGEGGEDEDGDENEGEEGEEGAVVINEIAWVGTEAALQDEWIELYNNTGESVDLTGWHLVSDDGGPDIVFSTSTIQANGFYLIERTDNDTVSDIAADWFGSFGNGLKNDPNCEVLSLYDQNDNLVDQTACSDTGNWPAGDNSTKQTMERVNSLAQADPANWASNNRITRNGIDSAGNAINGTPKAENSVSKSATQIINGFTITEDTTLTYLGNPYLVEGYMMVSGAKLTVEPGVTVKFKHVGAPNQDSLLKVENGILEAVGTPDKKITFTSSSTEPAAGDWDGLYLKNSVSTLENTVIRYGGMLHQPSSYEFPIYTYGAVYIDGGSAQISNSLIEKSGTFGLWLKNSTSSQIINTEFKENLGSDHNGKKAAFLIENGNPIIKNSIFRNNAVGILAENYSAPTIKDNQFIQNATPIQITSLLADISNNTFQDNNINGVLVRGFGFSDLVSEINWKKITVPYFVDAALTIPLGRTLRIEPGVEIRLKNSGQITADGNLAAQGTYQNKIIFTGASEVPGAWRYVKFSASSTDSILEQVIVSYGGFFDMWGGGRYGAVKVEGLDLVIKDSVFENNRLAIELINAGFASQSGGMIIKNNEVGIYVTAGSRPSLPADVFGTGDDANTYNILP